MFETGTRIGPYEIQSQIGEGGMGVVYRAHDTKLKRDVAIKTLPEPLTADAERLFRFQREAQALASLNHPNIAQIYGLEESAGGARCIVMELVAGETLQEQLHRGPLPLEDALEIAKQIADGLEAAHERGIIHRDLKPANIKRTPDGKVKILDFGLARVFDSRSSDAESSHSPTMMSATGAGMLLGTAAYMSPEQARGREAGTRADIWAFGAVLYELLTGRQAFPGETVTDILATVLKNEPDWSLLPLSTPESIRSLLRRCLQKDSRRRVQHIGDVRIVLEDVLAGRAIEPGPATASLARSRERYTWIAITVALLTGVSLLAFLQLRNQLPDAAVVRFAILPPADGVLNGPQAISPNGRKLAFIAADAQGRRMLWIRAIDSLAAQPLMGTEGAANDVVWSPDSSSIAFMAAAKLKRIDLSGGLPQTISDAPNYRGASWNREGVLLLGNNVGGIQRVAAVGGTPSPVTEPDKGREEKAHLGPAFLPDGQHFVYRTVPRNDLMLASLDSKQTETLVTGGVSLVIGYASPGYLLFTRETTLMAMPFDAGKRRATGDPIPVIENVANASVSQNGVLSYRALDPGTVKLSWFDRNGKVVGVEPVTGRMQAPNLSRDGKRVALELNSQGKEGVWILDLARGTNMRVTQDGSRPVFSPDGNRIIFVREGAIYVKSSGGTGSEERLESGEPTDWSPDGQHILFIRDGDLWSLSLSDGKVTRVVTGKGNDRRGRFSPDGKWFAYESDEAGRFEIYVQKFPPSGERVQVSANGGGSAWWRSDGRELFFNTPERKLMSVDIRPGNTFDPSAPKALFEIPGTANNGRFIATLDGQRFLIPLQPQDEAQPLTVILNWPSTIKK